MFFRLGQGKLARFLLIALVSAVSFPVFASEEISSNSKLIHQTEVDSVLAEGISYSEQERLSDFPDLENTVRPSSRESQQRTASLEVEKISSEPLQTLGCSSSVLREGADVFSGPGSVPDSDSDFVSLSHCFFGDKMNSLAATFSASVPDRQRVGADRFSDPSTSRRSLRVSISSWQISESVAEEELAILDLKCGFGEEIDVSHSFLGNFNREMCSVSLAPSNGSLLLESTVMKMAALPKGAEMRMVVASESKTKEFLSRRGRGALTEILLSSGIFVPDKPLASRSFFLVFRSSPRRLQMH